VGGWEGLVLFGLDCVVGSNSQDLHLTGSANADGQEPHVCHQGTQNAFRAQWIEDCVRVNGAEGAGSSRGNGI